MKILFAMLSIGALLLVGACSRDPSGNVRPGHGGRDAIPVVMVDSEFRPDQLQLEAGDRVTIEVTNEGDGAHNFTIDDLDLSTGTIAPGDVMTATFVVPQGTTNFRCTFHPGMDGTIVAD